jgi:hypothetical protein
MAKELHQPIITTHYPINNRRANKRWAIAQRRPEKQLRILNDNTEHAYHRIIMLVKQLHLKSDEVYFERDYKRDKEDGLFGMHSLITSTFYWRLDCSANYFYEVEFAFSNCYYEADIRHMLRAHPLDRQATERQLQPCFKSFYEQVQTVQEARFLHSLKGN